MAKSADPDQTPRSAASDLGLHSLLRHICPNIQGKYGMTCAPSVDSDQPFTTEQSDQSSRFPLVEALAS